MKLANLLVLFGLVGSTRGRLNERRQEEAVSQEEEFHVIIGLKGDDDGLAGIVSSLSKLIRPRFKRANALSAIVTKSELEALLNDSDILYVEEDVIVYPDSESKLYGLDMVQGESTLIPSNSATSSAACNDPNSFKIGIIDSGLAVNHPDIPCLPIDQDDTNCIGKEFGLADGDGVWYNPIEKFHGTHVAGTIGASGLNNKGIQGVINDGNICFIIGRVFGESGAGTRMSSIFEAVEWVVDQGAKVVSMSLGGPTYINTGDDIMEAAYNEGVLLVAASGNDGTEAIHYPANYKHVLSVAAVDENRGHASFSQYNDGIDIAAPGVDILSTFPLNLGSAVLVSSESVGATALFMTFATESTGTISGVLVDCPNYGIEQCPGDGGHICLIERGGGNQFEGKTLSCQQGGGIAAIIYNNVAGQIGGGLSNPTSTSIPALEMTTVDGLNLKNSAIGQTVSIEVTKGYGYLSGTSMAVPHVTGVIGKIWRACPLCTNQQVETCLLDTAIDLGETGKDVDFGNGLVQADAAYLCLVNTAQCCVGAISADSSVSSTVDSSVSDTVLSSSASSTVEWVETGDGLVAVSSIVGV